VKRFLKIATSTALLLTFAAIPLMASAFTIGVSDEINTSITSGHLQQNSLAQSWTNGTSSSVSSSSKVGTEIDNGQNTGSVSDPAKTVGGTSGTYAINVNSTAKTNGTYGSFNETTSSFNGMQVQTGLANIVSTFANP